MECTYAEAVKAGAEISWCQDKIFQSDIEYVRSDRRLSPEPSRDIDELRARLERLEMSWIERVNPEFVAGLGAGFFAGLVVAAILWSNG
jgi:hypothetical protein